MGAYKLVMPKMGESVFEATILTWLKKPGDKVAQDEIVLEVATDKVDSDVPSPIEGQITQLLFEEGDTVEVGKVLAIIETDQPFEQLEIEVENETVVESNESSEEIEEETENSIAVEQAIEKTKENIQPIITTVSDLAKYYSPLVLNIAQTEGISLSELGQIEGRGKEGRVTKEDMLAYLKDRNSSRVKNESKKATTILSNSKDNHVVSNSPPIGRSDEIIEMDRMRKLIANHMVDSKKTSAHVSSFVEADLTNVVQWRNKYKNMFEQREGFKLSFMPIFVEAITQAIKEYPMINVSVDGDKIIKKMNINVGVATALPSGSLIVPVIKNADQKSLVGIAREMNDIVKRARTKALRPEQPLDCHGLIILY